MGIFRDRKEKIVLKNSKTISEGTALALVFTLLLVEDTRQ